MSPGQAKAEIFVKESLNRTEPSACFIEEECVKHDGGVNRSYENKTLSAVEIIVDRRQWIEDLCFVHGVLIQVITGKTDIPHSEAPQGV